jgi:hypothetical protein
MTTTEGSHRIMPSRTKINSTTPQMRPHPITTDKFLWTLEEPNQGPGVDEGEDPEAIGKEDPRAIGETRTEEEDKPT